MSKKDLLLLQTLIKRFLAYLDELEDFYDIDDLELLYTANRITNIIEKQNTI